MRTSLRSKILNSTLKFLNFKKIVEKKAFRQTSSNSKRFLPLFFKLSLKFKAYLNISRNIVTIEPKKRKGNKHIIFFHGGAYIFNISTGHWKFVLKIIKKCKCKISIIDYPLAPEFNYKDTFEMVSVVYEQLCKAYSKDDLVLMGDSAGGGLALAFIQKLIKEKSSKIPSKIILLSPWLDLTVSNPEIEKLESADHILSVNMLKYAASKYSAGEDMHIPLLSPINGELDNIPQTIVFYGSKEIFNADCKLLSRIASENIISREYINMQHDWAIFPIPERNMLINEINEFL